MSNCIGKEVLCRVAFKKETRARDVLQNDLIFNAELMYIKVAKIETFINVECYEISSEIGGFSRNPVVFSKEHFTKENLEKLKCFAFKEVVSEVVAFFDENGDEIEVLPSQFIDGFRV